ncbi:tandem-95 repeat protein, partial [Actinokineospora sp.]|uniref:tandem-95 repeat protein n=1 Tax=Actinokineospora sp. TaxID=1872133 RepID=UPI003D6AFAA4
SSLTIDTVSLGAGTLTLNSSATANVPNCIYQANGQVNVFTPLNISASFTWSCGAFEGGDTITVSGPATLSDTACGNKVLNDPNLLNNLTTLTWTGGDIVIDGNSVFTNNGSFDIQTDADILAGGSLLVGAIMNPGTFSKSAGAGVTTVGVPYTSTNITESLSGTLSFGSTFTQNGPTSRLLLDGGSFSGSTFQINDGTIEGAGTIIGDVVNSGGTLRPGTIGGMGAGVINETGNNTQLIGGAYNAELGGTTPGNMVGNHDQLNATGVANLNGTLNVTLVDAFTPVVGNMFTILTATGGVNGTYSTINLPNVAPNEWQVQFNANDVTLVLLANAPPNALDDMYSTNEEVQLVVNAASGVLANDTDSTAMTVTTTPVMDVSNGTLMLNADGSFTYTPDLDFAGMDSFVYEVCDTEPLCSTATVTITVNGINDAPTFTGGPDVMVAEDAGAQTVAMWATAISPGGGADEAGQVLTFNVTNNTNPALFSVGPAVDGTSGDLTFTSAPDANGSADITVVLMDDGGTANGGVDTSGQQFFTINIAPVNDAPVANNDMFTVVENSMNNVLDVLPNDTDVDGDTLTVVNLSAPDMGGTAMTDGMTITYSPAAAFTGTETFTYDACDPSAACDTALVTVNVVANFPPNAVDDVANTNEDSFVDTNVLANDDDGGDGGTLSVVGFTQGAFGTVTDQGGGILRYTPNPDFNGMDSYTYDVSDTFSTDTGTVNVTVVAVNDAPSFTDAGDVTVAEDSGAQTVAGWASNIMPGPATATDEAGQALQFNVTANTNAALFSVQPAVNAMSGDLTFTPAADAFGSSDITVVLMDDGGTANGGVDTSASSTFTITVTNVNDPPVITAGPTSNPVSPIPGNTSTGANVAFSITVTDADNDPLTFSWTGGCGASAVEDPTLACPFGVGLSVDVTVDDGNGGMDMGNIVVDVTDYSIAANCTSGMPPCTSATMATITAGQAVDFDLTATGINGAYAANITYSCLNLPAQTTCSFSPSNMVANAPPGGVVTMLRIQTTAPGFAQLHAPSSQPSQPPFLALFMTVPGLALFGLVLAGGRRKRRGLGTLCLLAIALVMATVLVGCGSGGDFFTSLGNPGTPAGSHTIMIRAQGAGTLERTVDLTVVVQ